MGEGTGLGTIDSRRVPQIFWHERKSADNFPPRHHPGHSSDHKTRVTRQSENLLEECLSNRNSPSTSHRAEPSGICGVVNLGFNEDIFVVDIDIGFTRVNFCHFIGEPRERGR